ncbi:hypothetical protein TELCIR_15944 [Teladorsagia circumcincta]|uniref:Uncharacterized protein n=1 Tax=Teladorsagia circumcincta TaxID=45464 RepID=A0A2G9TX51_TELCI|nr:hypothetical protein TELCIR_15944 [Teladorsagia circumcincta]
MWWMYRLLYVLLNTYYSYADLCDISSIETLNISQNCDSLTLRSDPQVMTHPQLYEKIKTATEWLDVSVIGSNLERLCAADSVSLSPRE